MGSLRSDAHVPNTVSAQNGEVHSQEPRGDGPSNTAVNHHEVRSNQGRVSLSRDPALLHGPWFVNMDVPYTPILVAESSDSAFATRFRQTISTSQQDHLPRVDFVSDEDILALSEADCIWPRPARAHFLLDTALKRLGRTYHILLRNVVSEELEALNRSPASTDFLTKSKLLAAFAVGELYATRTRTVDNAFPGLSYFAKATRILQISPERPVLGFIEVKLLLSFYSLCLNRRHSAYSLAGQAVRLAVVMGLHLEVPPAVLPDPALREHRRRLWWTAYTFDRMWSAKLGFPHAVSDDDITVDLPSDHLEQGDAADALHPSFFAARVSLARSASRIICSIYTRTSRDTRLSEKVQSVSRDLRVWMDKLPHDLKIDSADQYKMDPRACSLQLLFNQLLILATRPVLLHVLKTRIANPDSDIGVPKSALGLAEACVRCARHSYSLLTDKWTNGSLMLFDYFDTQYLFSSSIILAISSLWERESSYLDKNRLECITHLLAQLKQNGNLPAAEFCQHTDAMLPLMADLETRLRAQPSRHATLNEPPTGYSLGATGRSHELENTQVAQGVTLMEPFFQNLLAQPDAELQFIDQADFLDLDLGPLWPDVTV
ncbi:unnamed protein product [Cercospora beticola]|nr:unnamed protein product [Cercospora beticola]